MLRKERKTIAEASYGTTVPDETLVVLQSFRESIGYGLVLIWRIHLPLMHHIDCFRL
jgi:hypothetical protein